MTQEKDGRPGNVNKPDPRSRLCQVCGRHPAKSQMMPAALVRSVVVERIREKVPNWTDDGYIRIDDLNRFRSEYIQFIRIVNSDPPDRFSEYAFNKKETFQFVSSAPGEVVP